MRRSRRVRIILLGLVSALALMLVAAMPEAGANRHPGGQVRVDTSSRTALPPADKAPPATPAGTPPTRATSTSSPPASPLPVGKAVIDLSARSRTGSEVTIPTTVSYPLTRSGASFPLLVFSPGYQIAPSAYEPLVTAWASAGYVVAEPNYPDTAPGAPPIEYDMINHPGELSQVITALLGLSAGGSSQISGLIDPSEVAVAGQSDGGDVSLAAASNTCCRDPRIKAAVILSGAEASLYGGSYFPSGSPPLLAVQGTADTVNPPACSELIYDSAPEPRFYLGLTGATHLSAYTAAGPQLSVVVAVTTAFLDGYVRSIPERVARLPLLGSIPGVSRLTSGPTNLPVVGNCPGSPGSG